MCCSSAVLRCVFERYFRRVVEFESQAEYWVYSPKAQDWSTKTNQVENDFDENCSDFVNGGRKLLTIKKQNMQCDLNDVTSHHDLKYSIQ